MTSRSSALPEDDPARWLHATRYVNYENRSVSSVALSLTRHLTNEVDKAVDIFKFVRDEVAFGFGGGFWDNRASDVLRAQVGYCNTKSTLFVALLRASGIPARQVFVDIDVAVLYGIISPGTPYVDHSYVEVFLNDAWIATDAYIVDSALFAPSIARNASEHRLLGYGVHATGTQAWDGRSAAFSQFNILDPQPISLTHWGVFEDVGQFYEVAERPWNRLNPVLRASFSLLAAPANRKANALRGANTSPGVITSTATVVP